MRFPTSSQGFKSSGGGGQRAKEKGANAGPWHACALLSHPVQHTHHPTQRPQQQPDSAIACGGKGHLWIEPRPEEGSGEVGGCLHVPVLLALLARPLRVSPCRPQLLHVRGHIVGPLLLEGVLDVPRNRSDLREGGGASEGGAGCGGEGGDGGGEEGGACLSRVEIEVKDEVGCCSRRILSVVEEDVDLPGDVGKVGRGGGKGVLLGSLWRRLWNVPRGAHGRGAATGGALGSVRAVRGGNGDPWVKFSMMQLAVLVEGDGKGRESAGCVTATWRPCSALGREGKWRWEASHVLAHRVAVWPASVEGERPACDEHPRGVWAWALFHRLLLGCRQAKEERQGECECRSRQHGVGTSLPSGPARRRRRHPSSSPSSPSPFLHNPRTNPTPSKK